MMTMDLIRPSLSSLMNLLSVQLLGLHEREKNQHKGHVDIEYCLCHKQFWYYSIWSYLVILYISLLILMIFNYLFHLIYKTFWMVLRSNVDYLVSNIRFQKMLCKHNLYVQYIQSINLIYLNTIIVIDIIILSI